MIAQETEKIIPEAVQTNENDIKSVNYNCIVGYLIEAIKKLHKKDKEKNKKIKNLEEKHENLQNKVKLLEEKINLLLKT